MKNLRLASIVTHVADAKTCVLHPASSTHRQMNDAELAAAGVGADPVSYTHLRGTTPRHPESYML